LLRLQQQRTGWASRPCLLRGRAGLLLLLPLLLLLRWPSGRLRLRVLLLLSQPLPL
jgi:hypothetical protein